MTRQLVKKFNSFDDKGAIFMSAKRSHEDCVTGIFGVPYDGTTCFRPGTRFGPSSIREGSNGIETFCPFLEMDLEDLNFVDLGSLEIPVGAPEKVIREVENATKLLLENKLKPLILGGEHSVTAGAVKACAKKYPELIVLQLDAHADLRMSWQGSIHSHACAMKRCLEVIPSKNLLQLGIRSGSKEEFIELKREKRLVVHKPGEYPNELKRRLIKYHRKPIYLTIDLDWFDPSLLPGTGTPEPGGFNWEDFQGVVNILTKYNLVGADVMELAPQIDPTGISSILAAKVTRTLLMLLNE